MRGITRVLIFCSLTTILPTILLVVPLYLRHSLYANVVYTVAESDIMEIDDGISTIFCSEHTLKMNTPFNAFKVSQPPEITAARKHIRLKKSMTLPDDTLEYWGFYLLKGATVALSVCSRFQGASILVVRGERSLRTCGMMEHNQNKKKYKDIYSPSSRQLVEIMVQSNAEEVLPLELEEMEEAAVKSTPLNHPLIPRDEDQSIFNDNNIVKVNYEVNPLTDKDNKSLKDVNAPESIDLSSPIDQEINLLREAAMNHIQKHTARVNATGKGIQRLRHMRKRLRKMNNQRDINNGTKNSEYDNKEELKSNLSDPKTVGKKFKRDTHQGFYSDREKRIEELEAELNDIEMTENSYEGETRHSRSKRNQNGVKPPLLLDRGVEHGGNAINYTNVDRDSSMSSFENGLLTCYDGQVLLAQQFEPSDLCTNISFLVNSKRIQTEHKIVDNGYYYYIFYSDNDFVSNDMHAVFDIYKPTFQYENLTQSCINKTECSFSLGFLSGDRVIVEVPTRNGIDDAEDDITLLTSTCHPRMSIYSIFPIAVLLLVLGCAFV